MGWDALVYWGEDAARVERLTGGVANDVWSVRLGDRIAVGRLGRGDRSEADLAWEMDLLQHLHREGMTVPVPIPTTDGRLFVDGLVVMQFMEGGPPASEADWRRVAATLRELHRLTAGWPQRPGWSSSTVLLHTNTGTKVDLLAMPAEAVARCRAAWSRLTGLPTSVVHGNPSANNIFIEAHVDVPLLDLVLPHNAAALDDATLDLASQASAAWEAAVCWDDDHSKERLAEVRTIRGTT